MGRSRKIPDTTQWLDKVFDAKQIKKNGLVRRAIEDVHKHASLDDLKARVIKEKWHLIESGGQYVVLCNSGAITIHL